MLCRCSPLLRIGVSNVQSIVLHRFGMRILLLLYAILHLAREILRSWLATDLIDLSNFFAISVWNFNISDQLNFLIIFLFGITYQGVLTVINIMRRACALPLNNFKLFGFFLDTVFIEHNFLFRYFVDTIHCFFFWISLL